ncbi:sulfatase [Leptospira langatensis]|uniref:Sulfatase n=1 Tax=Leptospira langatensis TaxID=2484983 RepID=A0A5F1ZT32_9LEPT|nr:sulfatase [Leptospira langatensis]TGK02839.1 sulfatase [Leptospira langatensis]TGL41593.1 sulfatase [Leptospira langatensis]
MISFEPKLSRIGIYCLAFFLLTECRQLSSRSFFQEEETVIPVWDGLRSLTRSGSVCQGDPEEAIKKISYHYKKNPSRYSGLSVKERWRNVQLTVLKDKENLLNESRDSLFLFQNGDCSLSSEFTIKDAELSYSSKTIFSFSTAVLSQSGEKVPASGKLEISLGQTQIFSREVSGKGDNWQDFEIPIGENIAKLLRSKPAPNWNFKWIPKQGGDLIFLGQPILYSKVSDIQDWGSKENLILIVVDALRPDRLGFGGSPVATSPNLDQLASESVLFENAFSNGNWTKPSMISFFTSKIASELGLGNAWFYSTNLHRKIFYSKAPSTLPNHLREKGYLTASFMNNVFLLDYTGVGVDLGFHKLFQPGKDKADTELILAESSKFLKENKDRRFFLHININTPHYPYLPERKYIEALEKQTPTQVWNQYDPFVKKYMAEILYTDEVIGKILEEAKKNGVFDKTWIAVVADHGELQSLEHYYHHHFVAENLHAHGESHYDEEIKVPWILHPPLSAKTYIKKWKFPDQVSLLSLFPTLVGALGFPCGAKACDGNDYSLAMFGDSGPEKEEYIYTEGRFSESIRSKEFKLIRRYPGYDFVRRTKEGLPHQMSEELYDLVKDPQESKNLALEPSTLLNRAREELAAHSLKKNTFRLRLPACAKDCLRKVDLNLQGGIYRIFSQDDFHLDRVEARSASISVRQTAGKEVILSFQTVEPAFGFRLSITKDGALEDYKSGKWGILSSASVGLYATSPETVASSRQPYEFKTSNLPYWYNDAGLTGNTDSSEQAALGKEVRKVLESWGYIHE